jgi:hypothetical protein
MLLDMNIGTANGRECSTARFDAPVRQLGGADASRI